jgi:hypothetical protein
MTPVAVLIMNRKLGTTTHVLLNYQVLKVLRTLLKLWAISSGSQVFLGIS